MLCVDNEVIDVKFVVNCSVVRFGGMGDGVICGGELFLRDVRGGVGIECVCVEGKWLYLGSDGEEDERVFGVMCERGRWC